MAEAIAIFKEPVKVSDQNERWLDEALNIWNSEFQDTDLAVHRSMYGTWSQNPREAQIFVRASKKYRQWLVEKLTQDLRLEDA